MDDVIRSKDNSNAKYLHSLHNRKKASLDDVVFLEGARLCEETLQSGIMPVIIAYTQSKKTLVLEWCKLFCISKTSVKFLCFTDEVFEKICSTVSPQGVAMVVKKPEKDLSFPFRGKEDIYVVLEDLQDPGNMGTIVRLADAFDFTAVLYTKGSVDPYCEKALRASMGSCWHIPLVCFDNVDSILDTLQSNGIQSIAMDLKGSDINQAGITLPAAYFIGNEGRGLQENTTLKCNLSVKIRMQGKAESLNAASAASIMGYILSKYRG